MAISLFRRLRLLAGFRPYNGAIAFTIEPTSAQVAAGREMQEKMMALVEHELRVSKLIRDGELPGITKQIRSKLFPAGRLSVVSLYGIGDSLAIGEKELAPAAAPAQEPGQVIGGICLDAYRRARREQPSATDCATELAA